MNIDFIKVPFTNNPSMQIYNGELFNRNPDKKYLNEKIVQHKKYKDDLFGEDSVFNNFNLFEDIKNKMQIVKESSFFELAMGIEEDIAVIHKGKLVAIHFSFPSGWIPSKGIGKDFKGLHQPVADNEKLIDSSNKLTDYMTKHTIRRWVWNITTIEGLSNHPLVHRPEKIQFENLFFRLETQISTPLDQDSSLFLVKVEVCPLQEVWSDIMLESINSMSDNVLQYKKLKNIKNYLNMISK